MNDRDHLAEDLRAAMIALTPGRDLADRIADRLTALGWTRLDNPQDWISPVEAIEIAATYESTLDEERLARALHLARHNHSGLPMSADRTCGPTSHDHREAAAVLAIINREDAG